MASNQNSSGLQTISKASNLLAMASTPVAIASNLVAMASTLFCWSKVSSFLYYQALPQSLKIPN